MHGYVEDLEGFLDQRIATVVPLRYGAGIKGKIGSSLAAAVPVVSTVMGAEGMDLEDEREVLLAESPSEFAAQVLRLVGDNALWDRLSESGLEFINRNYATPVARDRLMRLLARTGVKPFSGICPITGQNENRRYNSADLPDFLQMVPGGATVSERVLAGVLSELSGYPAVPLSRIPAEALPATAVAGEIPILSGQLRKSGCLAEPSQAKFVVARIPQYNDAKDVLKALLARLGPDCKQLALACPSPEKTPVTPRTAPRCLSEMIGLLEAAGWEVRCSVYPRAECVFTDTPLIEARLAASPPLGLNRKPGARRTAPSQAHPRQPRRSAEPAQPPSAGGGMGGGIVVQGTVKLTMEGEARLVSENQSV